MKRVLFLTYNYPHGHFGPSDNCSVRIIKALVATGRYEVHVISYKGEELNYPIVEGVNIHLLPFSERKRYHSRSLTHFHLFLSIPFYPFVHFFSCLRLYRATRELLGKQHFDLTVCQCNPEESVWAGTWLKKQGYIERLMVIFWDNIYGRLPRRVIPKSFSLRRQRWAEGIVARYADQLVSLYPIKAFHESYGELPDAKEKRIYLGIPSVVRPQSINPCGSIQALAKGKINMLYSGTIFRKEYVDSLVDILNASAIVDNIHLVFFQRGVSSNHWESIRRRFRGSIFVSDWIPLQELLTLYPHVNVFLSFPGNPTAIRSKLFEYVSYGKPLLVLYDDSSDVNITTFSAYPACLCIDIRKSIKESVIVLESYIKEHENKTIPFDRIERLFKKDSPLAYVDLIDEVLSKGIQEN